jgi:hypothetical protein
MADEILVHVSAPTTRQNDELYRSLASAYLEFTPCKIHRDGCSAQPPEQDELRDATLNPTATPITKNVNASLDTSISSIGKDSYGSFPSNISFGGHASSQEYLGSRPYHATPEGGSTSSMSRLARLDRSYLNWREKTTPKDSAARERKQIPQTPQDLDEADTAFIEDSQLAVQVLQSQLLDSYSTTDEDTADAEEEGGEAEHEDEGVMQDTSDDDLERVEETRIMSSDDNVSSQLDAGHITNSEPAMTELQSSVHADSFLEDTGSSADDSEHTEHSPTYGTLDFSFLQHGNNDEESVQAIEASFSPVNFSTLPVSAFAPAPEISVLKPTTLPSQITKSLSTLKTQNPTRFQPRKRKRTLEHDERGHWIVDCVKWPQKLQQEFWNSLYEHVCSGKIGWGTTLHRDTKSPDVLGLVRLYCWGEVVEHMWLLLWLCSQGQILGSRTKWVDASGVVVFEVA